MFRLMAVLILGAAVSAGAADPAPPLRAAIDATKTGEPISKYVYGQFIEHLGRCIYGGIWAERLQDRKFFYDVGSEESPWRLLLGFQKDPKNVMAGGLVKMVAENAYVGEHSPCIQMSGQYGPIGLIQDRIPLSRGEYVGRIVVAAAPSAGPIEVHVAWGHRKNQRQIIRIGDLDGSWRSASFRCAVKGDTDNGAVFILGYGKGEFRVGAVSLMRADNMYGMRREVLEILRELNAPVYRWPGGNFVSGYNWRDGIGDPDRRPPRKNPAWKGVEHNDFGIDEFMTFCRAVNAEPYIAVNSGLGNAKDAADEIQYANGGLDTPMGKQRAENKHPEPYRVKWWGIGNEMYGDWQLGHIPLEEYTKRHNEFAEVMRAADPSIQLVGVGATGDWSKAMLANCADHMDLLSEHFYCKQKEELLDHIHQIPNAVRDKATAHRQYLAEIPALANKKIPIALDEWNYWYGGHRYGEIGVRYYLKDGLGIAEGLHEIFRNSDLFFMANYAQTVNVLGAIKTTADAASFEPTGLVLAMYRRHYGTVPVAVSGELDTLDVAAAWRDDRKALTVGVVNPAAEPRSLALDIAGAELTGGGHVWTMAGNDPELHNQPGIKPQVKIEDSGLKNVKGQLEVPGYSASIFELEVR
ncbi:MAG: alpha-N-arabinofuranosidase [Candidatus Hydrogenedentes bacterium]|nr:alpha-N-arabinofuranosidase [Candidatus Hydrogenedentota bacterium]